ncbi:MAG: mechanosensitive ion channel protein MscS [Flavobacteriales bacterium]|nr:mechanosensitive ion channel protein MscS [Flavobacteriales bacterium]|tara:strand:- start:292 stop:1548 length:1257 start_codon:yes stop_codon:yes gene_type:complete
MDNRIDHILNQWLLNIGFSETIVHGVQFILELLVLLVLSFVADRLAKKIVVRIISALVKRTTFTWDDVLLENKVFDRLAHLAPALVIQASVRYFLVDFQDFIPFIIRMTQAYMIVIGLSVIISIFNTLDHYFKQSESLKDKPFDSYFQLARMVVYFLGGILIIAKIFDKNPQGILTAMGALTAVSMLVFKDTILGFVASIQLSVNDMIRVGDWVSMPKYGADGDVIKITLNTVKVQNWDKTISTIPTYSFVSDSFKNWRGMAEAGGRRIKRSLVIKSGSVNFCDMDIISNFKKFDLIQNYIETKVTEIDTYNKTGNHDKTYLINGRQLTNIGVFRVYIENYILSLDGIHPDLTRMVYQTEGNEFGIPIQIYCFTKTTDWAEYENIQSDIFDHLYAAAPLFGLEVFQHPSGSDFNKLAK